MAKVSGIIDLNEQNLTMYTLEKVFIECNPGDVDGMRTDNKELKLAKNLQYLELALSTASDIELKNSSKKNPDAFVNIYIIIQY